MTTKKKRGTKPTLVAARITESLFIALENYCERTDKTMSEAARLAVERFLAQSK